MCGRFSLATDIEKILEHFSIIDEPFEDILSPRYNIAPSQSSPVVVNLDGKNKLKMVKWGLIPPFARDEKIGYRMINARAENIEKKSSFKRPFKSRRCLVIADGFYEWKHTEDNEKIPYRFVMKDKSPFAMAGLWEHWLKDHKPVKTFTIITTEANELTEPIHHRMPVILPAVNQEIWMSLESNEAELKELLVPYDSSKMEYYQVSKIVNSWKNDVPECIDRV